MAKSKRKKKKSKIRKIVGRTFLGIALLILSVVIFTAVRYGKDFLDYQKEAERMVAEGGEEIFHSGQTSKIYDADGKVITSLIGARDSKYIEFGEIPYFVKAALITTEDRNFYTHSGVDLKAITRAFEALVKNDGKITQGGSTITQQLARNIFLSHEVTVTRKVKEILVAREIEKRYSKEKILEFYINNIYFGNGYYGIEAAANGYFSKSVTELSLGEIAYICSIPNNPTMYDPYINGQATIERKNRILKQMYEQDDIDAQMYEEALCSTIILMPSENPTNNYVETYTRYCATIALMKNAGFEIKYYFENDEEEAKYDEEFEALYNDISAKLYTGGYHIYTSIDMDAQKYLQETIDENLSYYTSTNDEGTYEFQGAGTCIDNATGKVVAIVGGRSQNYKGYTLNRAYQSFRQPGSSIKPILVYTPLLERGFYPETVVSDTPIENGPVNSPNIYEGDITLRYAVEKSKNTVPWFYYEELTPNICLEYLKNMDFKKIVPKDAAPAVAIGGMTYGVSTLEMASAYTTLQNDGVFRTPTCITKIVDGESNIIIDNIDYKNSKKSTIGIRQIYEKNASRMMTDVLKGVLTNGTGVSYNIENAICAAKTGTTNENKDVWFVGYSKYYSTAIWAGYDLPKEINDNYGHRCSGNIWNKFMTYMHEGKEIADFPPYIKENGSSSNGEPVTEETTTQISTETDPISVYTEETKESETTIAPETGTEQTSLPEETSISETSKEVNSYRPYEEPHTTQGYAPGGASGGVYQEYWGE